MLELLKRNLPRSLIVSATNAGGYFFRDPHVEQFAEHNRKVWPRKKGERDGVIIFDVHPYAQAVLSASYFLNVLSEKLNAEFRPFSYLGINNPRPRKIYESFGAGPEIVTRLCDRKTKLDAEKLAKEIFAGLSTKQSVMDIQVRGYPIGLDIYESYLRFCGQPTAYIDESLYQVILESVELVFFWDDFFAKNKVKALVLSHSCYNHLNIPAKICYKKGVPVYIPYARGMYRITRPFEIHGYFPDFPKMFSRLSPEEQAKAKEFAKSQIKRRISGEVGVDMPYSTKSAYGAKTSERLLGKNDKIKVLIASHCFYDNPYAFGDLLFIDFYEWISFLGQLAENTDYEWYLKMHPDPFPGTEDTMKQLLAKYPRIKMLPKETSHLQLVEEGLNFVLTAYGSVGHEYPALGVQVINAGYNPRVAYGFNWQPKNVDEYRKMLLGLKDLKLKVNDEELYEFYYMYHSYIYADDLIFQDFRSVQKEMKGSGGLSKNGTYSIFLREFSQEHHERTKARMREFLDSGAKYFFSKGPEKDVGLP